MLDNYDIALAALLHNIGKVVKRAGKPVEGKVKDRVDEYGIDYKDNGYIDETLDTVKFVEDNLKHIVKDYCIKSVAKYNNPETKAERIVSLASNLSTGTDKIKEDETEHSNYRLYSAFQNINIG